MPRASLRHTSPLMLALTCLLLAGCGGGAPDDQPELVPVTGTLTQGGKPLSEAIVTFEPETGGSMSSGVTDAMGKFELMYRGEPGAVVGNHTVRISKMEGEAGEELIPPEFNISSELTREVTASGPNDFDIEI